MVLRLWLALSAFVLLFTMLAFGVYVWVDVHDAIESAHTSTQAKVNAVVTTAARNGFSGPTFGQAMSVRQLGITSIRVLDGQGNSLQALDLGSETLNEPPVDQALLSENEQGAYRLIAYDQGTYRYTAISVPRIISGGRYGEEYVVPLNELFPERPAGSGFVRVTAAYADLSGQAHGLIWRSVLAAFVIFGALVIALFLFLHHVVTMPLRRYSDRAMDIAGGRAQRMPDAGQDELSTLGRALNSMAEALQYQATVDALTGMYNLRHLSSRLEAMLALSSENNTPLCVLVGDLDNLKPVNDTYGHPVGDRVLQAVALAMKDWAGPANICWRLGGDEFVVALPGCPAADGERQAESLRRAISAVSVPVGEAVVRASMSVGAASFPEDATTAGGLLSMADRHMYEAKRRYHEEGVVAVRAA